MQGKPSINALLKGFFNPGISRTLRFWFLSLSLLPLALVCLIGYQQSTQALRGAAIDALRERTTQQALFLENWFDFRFKDLRVQAESQQNVNFIQLLREGLQNSASSVDDYVGSYPWTKLVESNKRDLVELMQIYDYYYDLFLIDFDGNILFSLAEESDLGTNLYKGPFKDTLFASIVQESLRSGQMLFSDFEHYSPSDNIVAGFLSAPLVDTNGNTVGVFAAQIKVDTITELMAIKGATHDSEVSYLVGADLLARTAIQGPEDVLAKTIHKQHSHEQFNDGAEPTVGAGYYKEDFEYKGPFGQDVLGVHQSIVVGNIQWELIAEVDKNQALAPAKWMAHLTILLLTVMFFAVSTLAVFLSRRITKPLLTLAAFSEKAAEGHIEQQVDIEGDNEIAKLARSFNGMLTARRDYEKNLYESHEQAQQALLALEEQKFAFDQHAIVAITDTQGTITSVNDKFIKISGYSEEELIGQNHRLLNSGHHPKGFFKGMYESLARGDAWREEICNRSKDGHLYWVDSTIVPFKGADGTPTSYIAIRSDITARKQAEQSNENSLRVVKATLEATDNGLVVLNEYDKALHYNQKFLEIWHLREEQVIFGDVTSMLDAISEQLVDAESFNSVVHSMQANQGLFSAGSVHCKDGRILEYNSNALVLPGDKQGQVWSFNDITAKTRLDEEMRLAKEAAENATVAKSDFLANMSHEIRTPMNGVLGMLNLLASSELSPKQQHQVRLALSSGESLLNLINDILDFSKIEAGKMDLESIDFDLRTLVGDLAESMALQAQSKGLELVLDLTQADQTRVKGDPTRIRQLLTNLIGNALKFTHEGEIVIRLSLSDIGENEILLSGSVADTGIGIPEEKVQHLFDSFSQVDASTTRQFGGTGLGLSIVKRLCELMGGDIQVSSKVDEGSCFYFTLIMAASKQAALVRPTVDLNGVAILIVDDNATNREVLREQLEIWGAVVTEADSGASALRIMGEHGDDFAVAIIDMQMPKMDGAGLARALRTKQCLSTMKLIMMTSMSEPGDAEFFAELGFSAYFPKPTTTSDLFDALAVVLCGGEVLSAAVPLVTHNYLRSFEPANIEADKGQTIVRNDCRLLLVEDNAINQHVATGMLEDMGFLADIADNGAIALDLLAQAPEDEPYHLVLMDCQMPVLDGYQATAKIREGGAGERYRNITIVAMTANAMAGDRDKCLAAGMDDYIAKPIDPDKLEASLNHYLQLMPQDVESNTEPAPEAGLSGQEVADSPGAATADRAIWHRPSLLKRVRGKESLLQTLLKQFIEDMPNQIQQLEQAVEAEDMATTASLAHTIKGVAGNLSGQRLQHIAAMMEQAASQEQKSAVASHWPTFKEEYGCLLKALQSAQESTTHKPPAQTPAAGEPDTVLAYSDELAEELAELIEKIDQGSYVDDNDLAFLQPCCEKGDARILLASISDQLAQFDMAAATASLTKLARLLAQE